VLDILLWAATILIGGVVGPVLVLIASALSALIAAGLLIRELIKDFQPPFYLVEWMVVSLWISIAAAIALFAQFRLFAEYYYSGNTGRWWWYAPAWLVGAIFTGIVLTLGINLGIGRWIDWHLF